MENAIDGVVKRVGVRHLMSTQQAASYLGIARQTLYQWRKDVPRIRIGGRILFDQADLDRYIDAHREVTA